MKWNGNSSWTAHTAACAPLCPSFHAISSNCKLSVVSLSSFAAECGKKKQILVIVLLPRTVLVQNLTWRLQGLSSHHSYCRCHSQSHNHGTNQSTRLDRPYLNQQHSILVCHCLFTCQICTVRLSLYCTWVPGWVHSTSPGLQNLLQRCAFEITGSCRWAVQSKQNISRPEHIR